MKPNDKEKVIMIFNLDLIISILTMLLGLSIFIVATLEADTAQTDLSMMFIISLFSLFIILVGGISLILLTSYDEE
jgi:hypothetical protein|tara:strand:- start:1220 stop:1447 length:228 start_codon:yes stop_codon:yes gene_type:complete